MSPSDRIMAMIAVKEARPIEPAALAARVKALFPWLAAEVGARERRRRGRPIPAYCRSARE